MSTNGLISIRITIPQPVKITKMIPGGEAFKVKLQTLEEGKRYSLEFLSSTERSARQPCTNRSSSWLTESKETPELTVELEILVVPAVSVNPAQSGV
jgi:hypothetical protein